MKNYVQMFKMDARTLSIPNGMELAAHGRLAWLHRLLWRALVKMRALSQSMDERVEVLRLPVDNDSIFERIFEAYEGHFSNHSRPTKVLIGPRTLSELISCPQVRDWNSPFQFTAKAGFNRTIYGLPIIVVPQMEGVIVLDERVDA
jgi:hypothetical protein